VAWVRLAARSCPVWSGAQPIATAFRSFAAAPFVTATLKPPFGDTTTKLFPSYGESAAPPVNVIVPAVRAQIERSMPDSAWLRACAYIE
jgi:hypothetical protein